MKIYTLQTLPEWKQFVAEYALNEQQQSQFARYAELLREHNEQYNLTAIDEPAKIITDHFKDSLAITAYLDFKRLTMIADVGSGAGFPGIPLKIVFPHLRVTLIEVTQKKIEFLQMIIQALGLQDCFVSAIDWRTFLRKTDEPVDLFVSRASLHTDELMRMFKPNCAYQNRMLVYWASKHWQLSEHEKPYYSKEETYRVNHKQRRLIFFARHSI